MFANDKSIENLEQLYKEIKRQIVLQGEYIKLDLVEKLTILLSTLILIFVLLILGIMALFYFSSMLVYTIGDQVGGTAGGYAIMGGAICIIALIVYRFRQKIIFNPMVNFLAQLFLDDENTDEPSPNDQ